MRLAILALSLPLFAQQWSGILDPSRAIDWSATHPGVTGGAIGALPDVAWTICTNTNCNTLAGGTVTQTSIQNALSTCPTNQVVLVPAGSFTVAGWKTTQSNCVLRGAGADQTLITLNDDVGGCSGTTGFVGICMSSSSQNYKNSIGNGPVNLTGTLTKGSTTLTFATVPNLKVGGIVILDQTDDTTDDGSVIVSDTNSNVTAGSPTCAGNGNTPPCGTVGPISLEGNGGGTQRSGRQQAQLVTIVSCGAVNTFGSSCSGTSVSVVFSPGLAMANWSSGRTPQAWWVTNPMQNAGLENMSIDVTGAGAVPGIGFANATNSWISGVRMINSNRSHIQLDFDAHMTVRDSYFFLTVNSASQSYGVECTTSSDLLVENNIIQAVASPLMINGACTGSVYGYNFQINNYYSASSRYNLPGTDLHTGGIDNFIFEGNYGNVIVADVFHGSHHFVTAFRNRFTGPQPACWVSGSPYSSATFGSCNNSLTPVLLNSYSRFFNLVGNVLGTTGTNTNYQSGASNTTVYSIGGGDTEVAVTVPNDPNVLPTLMRWGNCDSSTGFGSCRFDSAEVPSGLSGSQAAYANPLPDSQVLPASFYYTSKPTWWPVTKAWPVIGPDVTGGNISGVSGHAYTIPAQDCFLNIMGGPADGTGNVLTFNASTCYKLNNGGGSSILGAGSMVGAATAH